MVQKIAIHVHVVGGVHVKGKGGVCSTATLGLIDDSGLARQLSS